MHIDKNGKLRLRISRKQKNIEFDAAKMARSELVRIPSTDGFMLPALISYPLNFDETKKYPVVFTIYGGPDSGGVRNRYRGSALHGMPVIIL